MSQLQRFVSLLLELLELFRRVIELRLGLLECVAGVGRVVRGQPCRAEALEPASTDDQRGHAG